MEITKVKFFTNIFLKACGVIFIVSIIILMVVLVFALVNPKGATKMAANFLIYSDWKKEKADAIVVITGSENEARMSYGAKLFKEGYGKDYVLSGFDAGEYARKMIVSKGVPDDKLYIDGATTTYENATFTKKLALEKKYKSFILVTAPDQSKRARMVFDRIYSGTGIKIYSAIIENSTFKTDSIMDNKGNKTLLATEYIKSLYYFIRYWR